MPRMPSPDLASPRFKADPYPFYARLRREAPVHRVRLAFWLSSWVVTRYDDVLAVLTDPRFSKEPSPFVRAAPKVFQPLNRNLLNVDPPDHTRLRTLVSRAFTPAMIERLRFRIEQVSDELLDAAARNGGMELVDEFALKLPLTIIADLLGIPEPDRRRFGAWTKRVAAATSGAPLDILRAQPSLWAGVRYLRGLIALRRHDPKDDLVTALLRAEDQGDKLDEDEILGMIALLLLAGYETTMSLIAGGTLALIQHPDQMQRLRDDPELAGSAVEELLRFTSAADFATFRVAREDLTIGATTIRRGDAVLAVIGSANRDETHFEEPDELDIAREPNRHLAFGMGAHFCLGAPLARLETQIAVPNLFRRFPDLGLAVPSATLRWRRGLFFRSLEQLPVATSNNS